MCCQECGVRSRHNDLRGRAAQLVLRLRHRGKAAAFVGWRANVGCRASKDDRLRRCLAHMRSLWLAAAFGQWRSQAQERTALRDSSMRALNMLRNTMQAWNCCLLNMGITRASNGINWLKLYLGCVMSDDSWTPISHVNAFGVSMELIAAMRA